LIVQDGGPWIGPGHNSVFRTGDGRWWSVHHAVERSHGRWRGTALTRRPTLIAELTWVDGWPRLAGEAAARVPERPGALRWADEFSGARLDRRWRPLREPVDALVRDGALQLPTAAGDLHPGAALAPLWVRELPDDGDLVVQARVALDAPAEGELGGFVQAGLAVLGADETAYLKLVHVAMHATRQTEFGIEVVPTEAEAPRYGSTVVGPPGDWTELRLRLHRDGPRVVATAYTRADGAAWVAGGTWVHDGLGPHLRLALLAMGGAGHHARFDHVRVWRMPASSAPRTAASSSSRK
jgi:hypothetical protein